MVPVLSEADPEMVEADGLEEEVNQALKEVREQWLEGKAEEVSQALKEVQEEGQAETRTFLNLRITEVFSTGWEISSDGLIPEELDKKENRSQL